ncbi:MAG: aromatic acid decarboxylase [Desulfosporosinus sp. BRH_c37]|nr:MAG: aromatic acid decarboxylase [Desulfosporosinus sp. BRH_c37]
MKLTVAITGASGAVYGIKVLEQARQNNVETHLILSKWAHATIETETNYSVKEVIELADYCHQEDNLAAPVASGSFRCGGMIIAPCSMKTLSAIANGHSGNLITRAADVSLKERRPLLLMVRETPLNAIHLENMLKLARLGVSIMPPVPAFYTKPLNLDDIVSHSVGRALDLLGIEVKNLKRWGDNI